MKGLCEILHIDLSSRKITSEPFPVKLAQKYLAGRGVNVYMRCTARGRNVPAFSPENMLVLSCGLITGTHAPASARLHVNYRSPLTGGMGSSNQLSIA